MKQPKKIAYSGFGLISLSVVFLLLYGYFNTVAGGQLSALTAKPTSTDPSATNTVGAIGGFHLLESIEPSDEQAYYRLTLKTRLNRSTILDQNIGVPLTKVVQVASTEPTLIDGKQQATPSLGNYRLQITLSDTGIIDQTDGEATVVFTGDKTLNINQPPITKVRLLDSPDGSVNQILVGLTKTSTFKVSSLPTGVIYIDILK